VKTTSGDAYDVTGPVVSKSDIQNLGRGGSYTYPRANNGLRGRYYLPNNPNSQSTVYGVLNNSLTTDADNGCEAERDGLGTPCGMRARSEAMVGTPSMSLGYYFTDEMDWVVEAQLLATPLKVDIYGDGPTALNGEKIIKLKMLPPTAVLGRYFGDKKDVIRPFIGVGASYAFFFDVKATDFLNSYVGGMSAGDTTIKVKNALGVGPFLGLKANVTDDWHISFNIGKLRYKTEATITTNNTYIDGNSQVLAAYGPYAERAISAGSGILATNSAGDNGIYNLMCDLAAAKHGNTNCNQGTFVRKQSTVLDATMFLIGVGHSF
jgi:outer membrane protein W